MENYRFDPVELTAVQYRHMKNVKDACKILWEIIEKNCPDVDEREKALDKLMECSFWANFAISRRMIAEAEATAEDAAAGAAALAMEEESTLDKYAQNTAMTGAMFDADGHLIINPEASVHYAGTVETKDIAEAVQNLMATASRRQSMKLGA